MGCFFVSLTTAADADTGSANDVQPIARWEFDKLPVGDLSGQVTVDSQGPALPLYPDFDSDNHALSLKSPAYVVLSDDSDEKFDFGDGDWITAEAWVKVNSLADNAYIAGKGRTKLSGSKGRDQNWAFRLRKRNGQASLNFLFHSQDSEDAKGQFHRWTSKNGFGIGVGWHHVAVAYQFGNPDSIVGFIDGQRTSGSWDLGGKTTRPPMKTQSPVWIGSAMGGSKGNSFDGQIDNLAIYRDRVSDDVLGKRFRFSPPKIDRSDLPSDVNLQSKVAVELLGPFNGHGRVPVMLEPRKTLWLQDTLAMTRLPFRYDAWGVRDDWTTDDKKTMLARAWTEINLEPGDYQLLVRSRGYSELFVDGDRVATTPAQVNRSGAHHVVDPLPAVSVPGMRPHAMNDHEKIVAFHSDGGVHELRFDVIVGGKTYRLEFGETCVAIAREGEMFSLISHQGDYPLTDDGWARFSKQQSGSLARIDQENRQQRVAKSEPQWQKRHQFAKSNLISGSTKGHTIDSLIRDRIEQENARRSSVAEANGARPDANDFYAKSVQPILSSHCSRCHGDKRQGELSVFDRENLLVGGESGESAIAPGDLDASYLWELVSAGADDYRMPPKGDGLSKQELAVIKKWIRDGAAMSVAVEPAIVETPVVDEATFLRRLFVDTVGVPPTLSEAKAYLANSAGSSADRRNELIDRMLDDVRWADNWVGYWQDVLAENPNLLKPTLNNTGPFRYWIHEALVDNKPIDRFATELIQMRGSKWSGGAGGFAIASQNDVPMAAKAHVIATAFMGVEMKCARCHDAPYHSWKQGDLFNLAAMLERKPIKLPATSTVPAAFFEKQERKSLIQVTLKPGETIHGEWPFAEFAPEIEASLLPADSDSRDRLALQVTASRRFAEVIANRVWKRLMGAAIVAPVDDWEGNPPSDPRLLAHLADTLIESDYDLKKLAKSIFKSQAYQRSASASVDEGRFFAGPYRRRMSAEQIVDSAFHVVGQSMQTEQLTMDVEGTLPAKSFLNFGFPQRSWEFTTLANERDRPSLALPRIQAIADVLRAFGWRNSRPEPTSDREEAPNLVQPGALANGTLGVWLTGLSDRSGLTSLMTQPQDVTSLVDDLFLQLLTRYPTDAEREKFTGLLRDGFDQRVKELSMADLLAPTPKRFRYVSWSNHLNGDANVIKVQMTELARKGDPLTKRLDPDWRARAEDAVWALINSPEMIVIP
ncbi:DUF1553 domain-containing protein [Stieleria marina]